MYRNELLLSGKVMGNASRPSERAPWKFTLTQGGGRKRDSEERYPLSYFNVVCWPDKCEGDASQIKSGDFVEVAGKLHQRSYVDGEGNKRSVDAKPRAQFAHSGFGYPILGEASDARRSK